MFWAILCACLGEQVQQGGCAETDSACRVELAVLEWEKSPKHGEDATKTLSPLEQDALVVQLFEQTRFQVPFNACESLRNRDTRRRCSSLLQRAHLWEGNTQQHKANEKSAQERSIYSDFPEIKPPYAGAAQVCQGFGCQEQQALRMIGSSAEAAARHCNAIETPKLQGECYFQLSEALPIKAPKDAAERLKLCLGAGPFRFNCSEHLMEFLSDLTRVSAFDHVVQTGAAIDQMLGQHLPDYQEKLMQMYWAHLSYAWMNDTRNYGVPQATLPSLAQQEWFCSAAFIELSSANTMKTTTEWKQHIQDLIGSSASISSTRALKKKHSGTDTPAAHRSLAGITSRMKGEAGEDWLMCVLDSASFHNKRHSVDVTEHFARGDENRIPQLHSFRFSK